MGMNILDGYVTRSVMGMNILEVLLVLLGLYEYTRSVMGMNILEVLWV